MVMRFLMTFVPVMRIITILALTMILIATCAFCCPLHARLKEGPTSSPHPASFARMVSFFLFCLVLYVQLGSSLDRCSAGTADCDDFNPIDKYVREKFNATCTYCPDYDRNG